jgi:hypothetical protein
MNKQAINHASNQASKQTSKQTNESAHMQRVTGRLPELGCEIEPNSARPIVQVRHWPESAGCVPLRRGSGMVGRHSHPF